MGEGDDQEPVLQRFWVVGMCTAGAYVAIS